MKVLSLVLSLILSGLANGGGVTIGNGSSYVVGIDLPAFRKESDLLLFTEGLLDETRSGRLLRVIEFKKQGKCNNDYTGLKGLETFEFYPLANATRLGERHIKGQLLVELKDCLSPDLIDHDGFEDIDYDRVWEL